MLSSPCSRGAVPFPCPEQFASPIACSAFLSGSVDESSAHLRARW